MLVSDVVEVISFNTIIGGVPNKKNLTIKLTLLQ